MSWNLQFVGRKEAVALEAAKQFSAMTTLQDAEKDLKEALALIVAKAIAAQAPGSVITVSAGGSAYGGNQILSLSIEPVPGFVE